MKKKRRIPYPIKVGFNVIIYIIFFAYMIHQAITADDTGVRWFIIGLTLLFGGSAVLYEFLRFNFDIATQNLIFWGDPVKALTLSERVTKFDVLKTFSTSVDIMHMLAYGDLCRYDDLKKYISELSNEKRQIYDVLIVMRHSQLILYGETGDIEKMEHAYRQLHSLRHRTVKGKQMKGAYFFNWDLVSGLHSFYQGNNLEALNKLKTVATDTMNHREKMQLYMTQARICAKVGRTSELKAQIANVEKYAGKNEVIKAQLEEMKQLL